MKKLPIDVHVLMCWQDSFDWYEQCLETLRKEPVNVWLVPGITGNIAAAREQAFQIGDGKYVSFVDPDDLIVPGIFEKLYELAEANPDCSGVYCDEVLIDEQGHPYADGWSTDHRPYEHIPEIGLCCNIHGQWMHHLIMLKREYVEKCFPLKHKMIPETMLLHEIVKYGPLVHLKKTGYMYRQHAGNVCKKHTQKDFAELKGLIDAHEIAL